jgi:hypothetical protein
MMMVISIAYLLHVVLGVLVLELQLLYRNGLNSECAMRLCSLLDLPHNAEGTLPDCLDYLEFLLQRSGCRNVLQALTHEGFDRIHSVRGLADRRDEIDMMMINFIRTGSCTTCERGLTGCLENSQIWRPR